ncbi:MAG: hypothetical protein AAGI44_20075 [Pseudomonadota bacterium]
MQQNLCLACEVIRIDADGYCSLDKSLFGVPDVATPATTVPGFLIALPPGCVRRPRFATLIGRALWILPWSRRQIANRLQTRMDYFAEAGGLYFTHEMVPIPVHENLIHDILPDDPAYEWFSSFPKRCVERGLVRTPSAEIVERLIMLELALRTPPLDLAV